MYDSSLWILNKINAINDLFKSESLPENLEKICKQNPYLIDCRKNGIPSIILELPVLLKPYKKLMSTFEEDTLELYDVFPCIDQTISDYNQLIHSEDIDILRPLIPEIQNGIVFRFTTTARWDLIITSFALTHNGRKFFRKKYANTVPPLTEEYSGDEEDCVSFNERKFIAVNNIEDSISDAETDFTSVFELMEEEKEDDYSSCDEIDVDTDYEEFPYPERNDNGDLNSFVFNDDLLSIYIVFDTLYDF